MVGSRSRDRSMSPSRDNINIARIVSLETEMQLVSKWSLLHGLRILGLSSGRVRIVRAQEGIACSRCCTICKGLSMCQIKSRLGQMACSRSCNISMLPCCENISTTRIFFLEMEMLLVSRPSALYDFQVARLSCGRVEIVRA
jgi:hypothetical protein